MKIIVVLFACSILFQFTGLEPTQDFQGKAYYFSKSSLELGTWGARMSEAKKKQIKARLKKVNVRNLEKYTSVSYDDYLKKVEIRQKRNEFWTSVATVLSAGISGITHSQINTYVGLYQKII